MPWLPAPRIGFLLPASALVAALHVDLTLIISDGGKPVLGHIHKKFPRSKQRM